MLPNRTIGWILYSSGISGVSSAVEAETVAILFIDCMAVKAMPICLRISD